ncbi:M14 family metallopeptidase [Aliiglaciecola sp. 3_MG-2023]|uniref:M14 family metallopeptidase n=1 Tax=Aliiglaciecola sp. 3_MG-2023 TaxID=3062644 RepID=UPI0026E39148|nr:M14 family metallopeptidase [Aliiglaciecola sp. 3_MG-2023]MDO6693195.1 M14 family metallopeptidase [Aliiglaciecola sp. 3_MG-2023]
MIRFLLIALAFTAPVAFGCEFEGVSFSAKFEAGNLDNCELNKNGEYVLTFLPEDKPINPSPWYYFSVKSPVAKTIKVLLTFDGFAPRYLPKVSDDQMSWQPIAFDTNAKAMSLSLDISSKALYVAAQRPVLNSDYTNWLDSAAQTYSFEPFVIGKSTAGRALSAFTLKKPENKEWVIFVGRQHPPEVTGAVAMFAFLDEFLAYTAFNRDFLSRFNVLVVPNINPDGVAEGHWRHSLGHKDLNRDWNVFSQPETKAVKEYLDSITGNGGKIVMGMDFHSTHNNVFYTIPQDENIAPTEMVVNWLSSLQEQTAGVFKVFDKPGTSPGKGVFKQFFADVYQVHGVTYEVGDNEPDEKTRYVAKHAAKTLIETLNATPPEAFYIKK